VFGLRLLQWRLGEREQHLYASRIANTTPGG